MSSDFATSSSVGSYPQEIDLRSHGHELTRRALSALAARCGVDSQLVFPVGHPQCNIPSAGVVEGERQ
jgi:hypothetical protein